MNNTPMHDFLEAHGMSLTAKAPVGEATPRTKGKRKRKQEQGPTHGELAQAEQFDSYWGDGDGRDN